MSQVLETARRLALAVVVAASVSPTMAAVDYTTDFDIDECAFASRGRDNPYFSLRRGDYLVLEGEEDGELVRVRIEVTGHTKQIHFTTEEGEAMAVRARAKHTAMGLEFALEGETFDDCVGVVETTPLEPGHESLKAYCPEVGLVMDNVAFLVERGSE